MKKTADLASVLMMATAGINRFHGAQNAESFHAIHPGQGWSPPKLAMMLSIERNGEHKIDSSF